MSIVPQQARWPRRRNVLRLENVPPEQMPEVVHIASELYERDRLKDAETQERQATVDAAKEVGLPEEYLHRAAAELHVRRIAQAQKSRKRRAGVIAVVGAALALGGAGGLYVIRSQVSAPPAVVQTVQTATAPAFTSSSWKLSMNSGTQASVDYGSGLATIRVRRFAVDSAGRFNANLNTIDGAQNLAGIRSISFNVHGTLPQVRLYLEHGDQRWRSPALPVEGQERQVKVDLTQFERQTRSGSNGQWEKAGYQAPETVDNLSYKTGWFVNDANASGDVTIGDVRFE